MRRLVLLTFVLLPACASSSASSSGQGPSTQTIHGGSAGSMTVSTSSSNDVIRLAYTPDAVWRIMPSVFDSLGITLNTVDQASKTVGNSGLKIRQKLGKSPLSKYLDCGTTQIGPNADSYDVILSVLSVVSADGTAGTKVSTTVEASAKPVTYSQGYSRCSSKGGIETRISELVKTRLAR